ncbi:MAG: hypothetical protein R2785_07600 [Flavobacteriaceae bacterium]
MKLASILFLIVSFVCAAQEIGDPPPPMPPPPVGLPIDGSVIFMLVVGLIFGAYKVQKLYKPKRTNN